LNKGEEKEILYLISGGGIGDSII